MKKVLILVLIVIAVFLFGCFDPTTIFPEDLSDYHDCGDDTDCLESYLPKCEKSFVTVTDGDSTITMTSKAYIEGIKENLCNIRIRIEKVELPAGADPISGAFFSGMQGKEMTCVYPVGDITLITKGFNSDFFEIDNCKGSFVDYMNMVKSVTGN